MDESADEARSGTRASETAVVCDTNAFNLRFLRAAMHKLGFEHVVEARSAKDLVNEAVEHRAQLVVFDPAMQNRAGVDAIHLLKEHAPQAFLVAFCSDVELARLVAAMGIVTVEKVGIMHLDALIAAVEKELGRTVAWQPEDIPPATDMDTPVWDLVPSLVDPEPKGPEPKIPEE